MRDLKKWQVFLNEQGVGYELVEVNQPYRNRTGEEGVIGWAIEIRAQDHAKTDGYIGFLVTICFDSDEDLVEFGIWE